MPITPAEIQQKTFSEAKRRGYEPSEVDEFLEQISRDIDAMLRKIADLKNRLTAAEAIKKATGHYGQWDTAAKYIDPRQE